MLTDSATLGKDIHPITDGSLMQKIHAKESFQLFEHKRGKGIYSMAVKRDLGFLGCLPAETLGRP